jgi:hypothetical protein
MVCLLRSRRDSSPVAAIGGETHLPQFFVTVASKQTLTFTAQWFVPDFVFKSSAYESRLKIVAVLVENVRGFPHLLQANAASYWNTLKAMASSQCQGVKGRPRHEALPGKARIAYMD